MAIYRRLLLSLLVFVCLFALSLNLCYAAEGNAFDDFVESDSQVTMKSSGVDSDSGLYKISYRVSRTDTDYGLLANYHTATVDCSNQQDIWDTDEFYVRNTKNQVVSYSSNYRIMERYTIARKDGKPIAKAGQTIDVKLTDLVAVSYGKTSAGVVTRTSGFTESAIEHVELWLADSSGTYRTHDGNYSTAVASNSSNADGFDLHYTFDSIEDDTYFLTINLYYQGDKAFKDEADASAGSSSGWDWYVVTRLAGFYGSTLTLNFDDNTSGLLSNIIALVNNIKDGVSSLGDGITNVFNSIIELPSKIWSFIEEGLKSLFIPDEDYIVGYKDNFDTLLSSRFGAIYQSGGIIVDYCNTILNLNYTKNTIDIPEVSYTFSDKYSSAEFTFGGQSVQLIPQGFEWLVDIIKGIIDIVVTLVFINGLKTKYEQLMEG